MRSGVLIHRHTGNLCVFTCPKNINFTPNATASTTATPSPAALHFPIAHLAHTFHNSQLEPAITPFAGAPHLDSEMWVYAPGSQ